MRQTGSERPQRDREGKTRTHTPESGQCVAGECHETQPSPGPHSPTGECSSGIYNEEHKNVELFLT